MWVGEGKEELHVAEIFTLTFLLTFIMNTCFKIVGGQVGFIKYLFLYV